MQKELSAVIPPNNYLIMDLKFRIISYYGRTENLQWAGTENAIHKRALLLSYSHVSYFFINNVRFN